MSSEDVSWMQEGPCRSRDPEELFPPGAAQKTAKRVCTPCPVKRQCLAYAKDRGIEYGVWGGMTERERRALDKQFPDVTDWSDLILGPRPVV